MGLLKETLEAINRIDRNLAAIRNVLTKNSNGASYRDMPKDIYIDHGHPNGSTFQRVLSEKDFCYPDSLTFGGRLRAVRVFAGLTQAELADDISVTAPHVSNLEADKSVPSAMLIRAVSRRFEIDEHWLATGKLEVRGNEGAAAAVKVWNVLADAAQLSRNRQDDSAVYRGLPDSIHIDMGDPAGDRAGSMPLSVRGEAEQEMCDSISQRLRLVGEEVDLDRQDRVHCSRYPSHCTQAKPEQQRS